MSEVRRIIPVAAFLFLAATIGFGGNLAAAVAVVAVALLSLLPLPARLAPPADRIESWADNRFPLLLPLLALLLTVFYAWLWGGRGYGFQPVVHDEFAYLFQAKSFLAGRLFFPPPPDRVAFDAFHILTDPVYASKYPPGHALLLLPGSAAGIPWIGPLLASGLSLVLLGLLAKRVIGAGGSLLLVFLFGIAPAQVESATTYLSQTGNLLFLLATLYFAARAVERGGRANAALAGTALGLAWLTRPLNASVLALFLAALIGSRREARKALLRPAAIAAGGIPLLFLIGTGLAYNRAVTGSPLVTPWQLYARTSQPEDTFGFASGEEEIEERPVGPGKRLYNETILYPNRLRYTPGFALGTLFRMRIPMTAGESSPPLLFLFLLPLIALPGGRRTALWTLLFIALSHGAYLLYWFPWGRYYHEITPALLLLPLLGARSALAAARRAGRPAAAWSVILLFLLGTGLAAARLPFHVEYRRAKARAHARFYSEVERKTPAGSILFLRYGRAHNPEIDFLNNDPDLAAAERVFAYDLGPERNRTLLEECFPERRPYLYDEKRGVILPGFGE
ncbi:MAG: glycosyltransferase family 39 protein [Candidatus Eisenbacteria bacterium]|nr:glycosyltransferase family 39 protein [Candidatus Eisenbacteria bacterium]